MTGSRGELLTVMYHYVRDVQNSEFPELKALDVDTFRAQVDYCIAHYEMASLASALAFLSGTYQPQRPLCLLTFDDGLADHYEYVTPILVERKVQGVFFLTTGCIEDGFVLPVHKNHFLMAFLGLREYRKDFLETLRVLVPGVRAPPNGKRASQTYRWDDPEVAAFKYLVNYQLAPDARNAVLRDVFVRTLGDEEAFAAKLYLSWPQAAEMRAAGMSIGGHTHTHPVLADCSPDDQLQEIAKCKSYLESTIGAQDAIPFAYPYGKRGTFDSTSADLLRRLGFTCGFSTEVGPSKRGDDQYAIPRVDPKDIASAGV